MRTNYDYIFPTSEYRATLSLEVEHDELRALAEMATKVVEEKYNLELSEKQVKLLARLQEELWCSLRELEQYKSYQEK